MDNLYSTLFNSKKDIIINNINYEYVGKGGQGVVFKIDNYAIKIIPKEKNLNYIDRVYYISIKAIELNGFYLDINSQNKKKKFK